MHMTLNEALVSATLNSAASLKKSETHGSLERGMSWSVDEGVFSCYNKLIVFEQEKLAIWLW